MNLDIIGFGSGYFFHEFGCGYGFDCESGYRSRYTYVRIGPAKFNLFVYEVLNMGNEQDGVNSPSECLKLVVHKMSLHYLQLSCGTNVPDSGFRNLLFYPNVKVKKIIIINGTNFVVINYSIIKVSKLYEFGSLFIS